MCILYYDNFFVNIFSLILICVEKRKMSYKLIQVKKEFIYCKQI